MATNYNICKICGEEREVCSKTILGKSKTIVCQCQRNGEYRRMILDKLCHQVASLGGYATLSIAWTGSAYVAIYSDESREYFVTSLRFADHLHPDPALRGWSGREMGDVRRFALSEVAELMLSTPCEWHEINCRCFACRISSIEQKFESSREWWHKANYWTMTRSLLAIVLDAARNA